MLPTISVEQETPLSKLESPEVRLKPYSTSIDSGMPSANFGKNSELHNSSLRIEDEESVKDLEPAT
jgi:hypothetical protein